MSLHGQLHMTEMMAQGRGGKKSHMNVHKAHLKSQITFFNMSMRAHSCPHTERIAQMILHEHPQMTHPN